MTDRNIGLASGILATKEVIRKDKVGIGVLLQLLALAVFIFTFFTIIGPIIGIAFFILGGKIHRCKRYICSECRNEVNKESKICPACSMRFEEV